MRSPHRSGLLAIAVTACMLAVPATAPASQTLGEANAAGSTVSPPCPTDVTVVQTGVATGGPSYVAPPSAGVITSWSYFSQSAGDLLQLDLVQPATVFGDYTVVGRSDRVTTVKGANTFLTRLPTHPGDMLGITDFDASSSCWRSTSVATDKVAYCTGCDVFTPPVTRSFPGSQQSVRLNVSAVLEPDADGDGYGDETQDKCLDDPYTAAQPCSADVAVGVSAPATITVGGEIDYQVTIMNNGPSIAKGVTIVDALPPGVTFLSSHSTSFCNGTTTVVCTVPPITPYTTAPATFIAVSAGQLGMVTNTVSAGHSVTPDPNPANDAASATTSVTPVVLTPDQTAALFAGVSIPDQTLVPSSKRLVKVKASCPAPATVRCRGTLTLKTQGKVTLPRTKSQIKHHKKAARKALTLGKATFSIALGKSASIPIRISQTGMSILARSLSMDTTATAAASDADGHTKTTSGHVLLVAPDKPKKKHKKPRKH